MYRMVKANGLVTTIGQEAPTGIAAFIIAEFFYKFHSFSLECIAFLATWFVFSWIASKVSALIKNQDKEVNRG